MSVAQGEVRSVLHPQQRVSPVELVRTLHADAHRHMQDFHYAMSDELDFSLSLKHYVDDAGNERDKRVVQPHSLDLFHLLRHKWSQIARSEIYIECLPVDDFMDADLAEDCKFALESVINDRRLRYKACRRRMVIGALAARAWAMKVEFDPRLRPYGDLVFGSLAPWDLVWAPGWTDFHDATCPWLIESGKMRVNDVLQMGDYGWNVDGVQPTGTLSRAPEGSRTANTRGHQRVSRRGQPTNTVTDQDAVTVLKAWFREDPYTEGSTVTSPTIELDPKDRYYECPVCFHTELGSGEAMYEGGDGEVASREFDPIGNGEGLEDMPEYGPVCPNCQQAEMVRADFIEQEVTFLRYPEGRLIIVCPELDLVLYDDKWPVRLRSFPYMLYRAYDHPEDGYGQSDTSLMWTMVLMQDATFLSGWEQMVRNVDLIMTPADGLQDANGQPFQFTSDHGSIAYFKDPMAATLTKHFQGSGISAGWPVFLQAIQQSFRNNMGFNDVGLTGPELANATAGAVNTAVAQGEIPVQDHIDVLNEEQSMFLGVVLDYIIGTWTEERWVRYSGFDGMVKAKRIMGSDLPYADVEVAVQPKLSPVQSEMINAFTQWLGFDPPARAVMAKLLNLPPSLVRQYEQARMQFEMASIAAETEDDEGSEVESGESRTAAPAQQ